MTTIDSFGDSSSPYLAVKTLQQTALDFGQDYPPNASFHVANSFYVDDLLAGADTPAQALALQQTLRALLATEGFDLRKWRSSSEEVVSGISEPLLEKLPNQDLSDNKSVAYPKALGIGWNSSTETMYISINSADKFAPTGIGWLAPTIVAMKILYQRLWEEQLG